jgi:hypothetical protein
MSAVLITNAPAVRVTVRAAAILANLHESDPG